MKDLEKGRELLEEKLNKMSQDVSSYLQLMEGKDESIVTLSNKLDELELSVKIDKAGSPPAAGQKVNNRDNQFHHFSSQQMEAPAATSATWRRFLWGLRPRLTRRRSSWRTQSRPSRCRTSF